MQVTFRRARREDVPDLVRMLRDDELGGAREQADGPVEPSYWRAFEEIERDKRQLLVVAEHEGSVVGTLQVSFIPYLTFGGGERGQIEAVRVDRSLQGLGIGQAMMRWAIEQARDRGCHMVQLTTNKSRTEVRNFYEKLGFEATHEGMKLYFTPRPGTESGPVSQRNAGRER